MAESGEYSHVYANKGLSNEVPGVEVNRRPDAGFTKEINKVFLGQAGVAKLPMTELQAIRVNFAVSRHNKTGLDPDRYLFPCQIELREKLVDAFEKAKAQGGVTRSWITYRNRGLATW